MLEYEEARMRIIERPKKDVITTSDKVDVGDIGGEFGGNQGDPWPVGN